MYQRGILISVFLLLFTLLKSQSQQFTKSQMLEDYDQLVKHINTFAVHKDLNAVRLGIDYEKEFSKLRSQINDQTTVCDFNAILNKATFLVQDQHCCFMPYSYLAAYGKYQNKFNFKNKEKYEAVKLLEEQCSGDPVKLNLPLLYQEGHYYVYTDFTYKGQLVKKGSEVIGHGNQDITSFIKNNYENIWAIKWDENKNQPYQEEFYKYGDKEFTLSFKGDANYSLKLNLKDSITFNTKQEREIGYYSQSMEQVLYLEESKVLYVGLPFMDLKQATAINAKIDSVVSIYGSDFAKVIVDVRGNPGGSDRAWRKVLGHIISDEINYAINLKYKYKPEVLKYYNKGNKKTPYESESLLAGAQYWTQKNETLTIKPDEKSLNYKGKIYVLQDKFIYSSAGNFSSLCLNSDQLISVGEKTDIVGGLQTDPLFFKLKNSGWVFRIEPMLDFSDVKSVNDFSHNHVEIAIPNTIDDYEMRTTYKGDIYGKEFLIAYDKLVKYVLGLKM